VVARKATAEQVAVRVVARRAAVWPPVALGVARDATAEVPVAPEGVLWPAAPLAATGPLKEVWAAEVAVVWPAAPVAAEGPTRTRLAVVVEPSECRLTIGKPPGT